MSDEFQSPRILFERLEKKFTSSQFLNKEGLGMEVPFFICPFQPSDTVEIERKIALLKTFLSKRDIPVLELNLYDECIEILKEQDIFDDIEEQETGLEKEELKELLQGSLDTKSVLVPHMQKKMEAEPPYKILFITGIGEVFPFVRTHSILNNMQSVATTVPTVFFYPGKYTYSEQSGKILRLFDLLTDDRYYRAFNLLQYEVLDD